ncbi:MAG: ribosome small subunit-dependent GTPase A [Actinomycetota bacterium]|nr:ribosome small subunit-dependent GTPase A [Actinomycetota bacterium]
MSSRRPSHIDGESYDEDSVRVRPSRHGSRARTRTRPAHLNARLGTVLVVDRGRFRCLVDGQPVTAMRARELGRRAIVVGDRVRIVGDVSGGPDALARIVSVEKRASELRRTADDTDPAERVVVANADQLVVVTAIADPPPRTGFIDRCLVAAFTAGLDPLLCLTKGDLGDATELFQTYEVLNVPAIVVRRDAPLDELAERLSGRTSVLIGHSGVGKSSLVNRLVPDADRAIGEVSKVGKGRHTSSSAILLPLPGGGSVIDTPGIRSFGLAHVSPDDLLRAFADLAPGAEQCPPGCAHQDAANGCALDAWVGAGHAEPERLESYRRLAGARLDDPDESA